MAMLPVRRCMEMYDETSHCLHGSQQYIAANKKNETVTGDTGTSTICSNIQSEGTVNYLVNSIILVQHVLSLICDVDKTFAVIKK